LQVDTTNIVKKSATRIGASRAAILLFVGSLATHGAVSLSIRAPTVYEDEYVFMGLARMLAGAGPEPDLNKYYPGLSFLLAPIYFVVNDQQFAYRAAQALNVLLVALMAPLAFYIFRRLAPYASRRTSVLVASLTIVYPAYLLTHAIVWSEALTAVAVMAVGAFGIYVWSAPTPGRLFTLGLVAGLIVVTHQRAITIPLALLMVLTYLWINRRIPVTQVAWPTAGVVVGGVVTLVALFIARVPVVRPTIVDSVTSSPISIGDQLASFASLLVGQTFYIVAASGGLAAVAVVGTISVVAKRKPRTVTPAAFTSFFFVVAGILTLILSAGFLRNGTSRADYIIYGRYTEILMIPLILVGISYLWGIAQDWSPARLLGTTLGPIAVLGAVTIAVSGWVIRLPALSINMVALSPAILPTLGLDLRIALAFGLALGLIVTALLPQRHKRVLAVVALATIWLVAFLFAYRPSLQYSTLVAQQSDIVEAIESSDTRLGTETPCIAYKGEIAPWMYYYFSFELAPRVLERANADPCSRYLLTIDEQDAPPGAQLVVIDSRVAAEFHRMLWILDPDE